MISNTTISAKYTVIAGVLQFSIPFRIYKTTDVSVFWSSDGKSDTPLTLGTDYSVVIGSEGGTVTLVSGKVPVGSILAIEPNFTATQETDLSSTTAISTEALEAQLDKQTLLILQQQRRTGRAVILPATSSESPEDVVASIYASRDAAAASAIAASNKADAAEVSAQAAANSASTAAQAVTTATEDAVSAATVQANSAHDSALAAAASAAAAADASEGMAPRMDAVELKNTQQDARIDAVEAKNTQQDTALLSKANTALDNISAAGKSAIAKACMPGNTTVNISLGGAYSTTYYWQNTYADGDISICFRCNLAAGWSAFMGVYNAQNGTARKASGGVYPSAVGADVWLTMRVKKGDYIGYNMYGCYPYAAFITYVDGES